jgi:hypothetical protein
MKFKKSKQAGAKSKLWAVRRHSPGWAPMFMSWHASEDAAKCARRKYAKTLAKGTWDEVMDCRR